MPSTSPTYRVPYPIAPFNAWWPALLLSLSLPVPGLATLGQTVESTESVRLALSARRRNESVRARFVIREVESDSVRVREFLTPNGRVFGVAWNGLRHPDLDTLLGAYHGHYRNLVAARTPVRGARRLTVRSSHLIVELSGKQNRLHGRAFDPALIPEGVNPDEIQ